MMSITLEFWTDNSCGRHHDLVIITRMGRGGLNSRGGKKHVKAVAGITRRDREYQDHHRHVSPSSSTRPDLWCSNCKSEKPRNSDRSTTDTPWVNTQLELRELNMSDRITLAAVAVFLIALAARGTASARSYSHAADASHQEVDRSRSSNAIDSFGRSSLKLQVGDGKSIYGSHARRHRSYPNPSVLGRLSNVYAGAAGALVRAQRQRTLTHTIFIAHDRNLEGYPRPGD
jgi:hypothetical protein